MALFDWRKAHGRRQIDGGQKSLGGGNGRGENGGGS
jgi:hypothetical protein